MNWLPLRRASLTGSKNTRLLRRRPKHRAAVFSRPAVECLEDRCLPSVVGPLLDNQGQLLTNVQYPVNINGELFFSATDGVHGQELFKSNGTQAGAELVADINPGSADSNPSDLTNVNGTLFFTAYDPGVGRPDIWESDDGTSAGTYPLGVAPGPQDLMNVSGKLLFLGPTSGGYDLYADLHEDLTSLPSPASVSTDPADFAVLGNKLYFVVTSNGQPELWQSDGTVNGTFPVKASFYFTNFSTSISDLVTVGNTLYFTADTAQYGTQVWALGMGSFSTTMLTDINPTGGGLDPQNLTNVNGTLYFTGLDPQNGFQLWKSDGTAGGTVEVTTIDAVGQGLLAEHLTNVNGTLFFAGTDGVHGVQLWKSDGTAAGTVMLTNVEGGSDPHLLVNVNGALFFAGTDGANDVQLWESDGTAAGTVELTTADAATGGVEPYGLSDVNGTLFTEFAGGTSTSASPPGLYMVPNTPPLANSAGPATTAGFSTPESTPLTVSAADGLLAYGSPASYGSRFTAKVVTGPNDGSLSLNEDGSFTYTPNPGFVGTDSFSYQVTDGELTSAPGTATIDVVRGSLVAVEGSAPAATEFQPATGIVGIFADLGGNDPVSDYTALIDWGDGASTLGTVVPYGDQLYVFGTHTYTRAGNYYAEATLFDADGTFANAGATSVSVADAPLQGRAQSLNFVEGASGGGVVAIFRDTDPAGEVGDYTATIDWGDGSTSPGTVAVNGNEFMVNGTHTYAEEHASIPITVIITDFEGAEVVVTSSAIIADAPLGPVPGTSGKVLTLKVAGGKPFTGTVATFSDANHLAVASDFTATITWDDGTSSAGTISGTGPFTVTGTHLFAPFNGTHHITVAISDAGGSQYSVTVAVTDPTTPNQIYVFAAYQQLVGQPPAYTSMVAWAHQLDTGALTRSQFVLQVEGTTAYRDRLVQALYEQYLNEAADAAELTSGASYLAHHSVEQLAVQLALPGFDSSAYRVALLEQYIAGLPQSAQSSELTWAQSAWHAGWSDDQVVAHVLATKDYWTLVEDN